jgi:hypothetical protein
MEKKEERIIVQHTYGPYQPYNIKMTFTEFEKYVNSESKECREMLKELFKKQYPDIKIDHNKWSDTHHLKP